MDFHINTWPTITSIVACSIATMFSFDLIKRLYLASSNDRGKLLGIYTLLIGTALYANHWLIMMSFHTDMQLHSVTLSFLNWLCALVIAGGLLTVVTMPNGKIRHLLYCGLTLSIFAFAMFYTGSMAIHHIQEIQFDPIVSYVGTAMSGVIITLIGLAFYWMRSYSGAHPHFIKSLLALGIAFSILAIHLVFESGILHTGPSATNVSDDALKQMVGITIGLAIVCLFMLFFIFTLFFEKHGVKIFDFDMFDAFGKRDLSPNKPIDSLTLLPNRKAFESQLKSAATRSTISGSTFALAYIDLDHFKPINDQYGHHAGDHVLVAVANRLNGAVRNCDFVARIGGDEFVAIIENIRSEDDIIPIVERVLASIREPFRINESRFEISCSVGIAIYPKDGDIDKLMICADTAMYRAKEQGKNRFQFFDAEIAQASDQMVQLQRELRHAMANDEFRLVFQPKLDCRTLSLKGAEALIRWQHPTKGIISPREFLPAAEHFGLANQIGEWVVEECCRTIFRAKQAGIDLHLSINLSQTQFNNPTLVEQAVHLIDFYGLNASNISFEIKETSAIANQTALKTMTSKLKAAGIGITLDDFGLHPVSLNFLQELGASVLKLDKVFVSVINENKSSRALITGVIHLAHALGIQVVAEGVENETQWEALKELNCDQMQGFLFSKPLNEVALLDLHTQISNESQKNELKNAGQLTMFDYPTLLN